MAHFPRRPERLLLRRGRRGAAGGIRGLVEFWDRFGAALEYDLFERGIDIRDCIGPQALRTRDWRTIWRLKDRLPLGSHYKTALSTDRTLAELFLDDEAAHGRDESDWNAQGFTAETYLPMTIADNLQAVQAAVIAAAGVDLPPIVPIVRPTTALDDLREERRRRAIERLVAPF
ncbi:hypothetical protein [Nocardia sp. MW-W600-9]